MLMDAPSYEWRDVVTIAGSDDGSFRYFPLTSGTANLIIFLRGKLYDN